MRIASSPTWRRITFASAFLLISLGLLPAQEDYEREPFSYWKTAPTDPVARLKARLEKKELELDATSERAFLEGVLRELNVPVASQVLVFSKTSLQRQRIDPSTPRALYFSDDVYVGWVPGGGIELAAFDPHLGPTFYMLGIPRRESALQIVRSQECVSCHVSPMTGNVPGFMVRSVFTNENGEPILRAGTHLTSHNSPFEERWGGWYVTGQHDPMRHMGNVIARETASGAEIDREKGANLTSLRDHFDVSRYLLDQSDIIALLVLEHQVGMHDRFAQASYAVRSALYRQQTLSRELNLGPVTPSETTQRIVSAEAEKIVRHMLFADEAKMSAEGVSSNSSFADDFQRTAPRDSTGQSLKSLRLGSRLFRNRCSYMIYSTAFDGLPPILKARITELLRDALAGPDSRALGSHISPEEKARIVRILRETKPGIV